MKYKTLAEVINDVEIMDYINYFNGTGVIQGNIKKVGQGYRIEPNPLTQTHDSFNINTKTNLFKCFSTGKTGNIYNLLLDLDYNHEEAIDLLNEFLEQRNIKIKKSGQPDERGSPEKENKKDNEEIQPKINFKPLYDEGVREISKDKNNLFTSRGISREIQEKYKLGYIAKGFNEIVKAYKKEYGEKTPFAEKPNKNLDNYKYIIPITEDYFLLRSDIPDIKPKEYKLTGYTSKLFNERYLNMENEIIFICEGIFDSLSLEELGYKSISLGGVMNQNKLIEQLHKKNIFVLALDNDKSGKTATESLKEKFQSKSQLSMVFEFDEKYKDINEYLIADKKALKNRLSEFIKDIEGHAERLKKPDLTIYRLEEYLKELETNKEKPAIKTNFGPLDDYLSGGLHTGLYVIGAVSSLGKTTFINQLTDDIAKNGYDVLFFSLEMGRNEIISKSLSREMFRKAKDKSLPLSALEIQNLRFHGIAEQMKKQRELLREAIKEYGNSARHVSIIEGGFDTGVNEIKEIIERYISLNKTKPIVVIDYLQILKQSSNFFSDKQAVDHNITQLKKLSRNNDLVIFVVSSFNRDSYLTPVSFASFKESGAIEYTADVVFGLELSIVKTFTGKGGKEDREKAIHEAKSKGERELDLVTLKNRFGSPYFRINMTYYPKFNLFLHKKSEW